MVRSRFAVTCSVLVAIFSIAFASAEDPKLEYRLATSVKYQYSGVVNCNFGGSQSQNILEKSKVSVPFSLTIAAGKPNSQIHEFSLLSETEEDPQTHVPYFEGQHNDKRSIDFGESGRSGSNIDEKENYQPILIRPWSAVLPNLPTTPMSSWEVTRHCYYRIVHQKPPKDRFSEVERTQEWHHAIESYRYRVSGQTEQLVTVEFNYEGRKDPDKNEQSSFYASGSGKLLFDRYLGLVQNFKMSGSYSIEGGDEPLSDKVSITMKFEPARTYLRSGDVHGFLHEPPFMELPLSSIEGALKMLKIGTAQERHNAVFLFYRYGPNAKSKQEVLNALRGALTTVNDSEKYWCAAAIGRWGMDDSTSYLKSVLSDKNIETRLGAIEGLAANPTKENAETIAQQLNDEITAGQAERCLVKMGAVGVDSLGPYLSEYKPIACCHACKIVGLFGADRYSEDLKELAKSSDQNIAMAATEALQMLRQRQNEASEQIRQKMRSRAKRKK